MLKIEEMPDFLTTTEVAEYLRVCTNTLERWEKKGLLKFLRLGTRRDRRMRKTDLINFINSR